MADAGLPVLSRTSDAAAHATAALARLAAHKTK